MASPATPLPLPPVGGPLQLPTAWRPPNLPLAYGTPANANAAAYSRYLANLARLSPWLLAAGALGAAAYWYWKRGGIVLSGEWIRDSGPSNLPAFLVPYSGPTFWSSTHYTAGYYGPDGAFNNVDPFAHTGPYANYVNNTTTAFSYTHESWVRIGAIEPLMLIEPALPWVPLWNPNWHMPQADPFIPPGLPALPTPSPIPYPDLPARPPYPWPEGPEVGPFAPHLPQPGGVPDIVVIPVPVAPPVSPTPNPSPDDLPSPRPKPRPNPDPATPPAGNPGTNSPPAPGSRPSPSAPPWAAPAPAPFPNATPTPGGRGTKERKVKFTGPYTQAFMWFIDFITETQDFVEAIYDALPDRLQVCRPNDTVCQARVLRYYWRSLDITEVLLNLIANQVEDAIIGRLNQMATNSAIRQQVYELYAMARLAAKTAHIRTG